MNIELKDGNIIITLPYDPTTVYPKSATGKSKIVGTTNGFTTVEGGPDKLKVSLNVIEIIPKGER